MLDANSQAFSMVPGSGSLVGLLSIVIITSETPQPFRAEEFQEKAARSSLGCALDFGVCYIIDPWLRQF